MYRVVQKKMLAVVVVVVVVVVFVIVVFAVVEVVVESFWILLNFDEFCGFFELCDLKLDFRNA